MQEKAFLSIAPIFLFLSVILFVLGEYNVGGGFVSGLFAGLYSMCRVFAGCRVSNLWLPCVTIGLSAVVFSSMLGVIFNRGFLVNLQFGYISTALLFDFGVAMVVFGMMNVLLQMVK